MFVCKQLQLSSGLWHGACLHGSVLCGASASLSYPCGTSVTRMHSSLSWCLHMLHALGSSTCSISRLTCLIIDAQAPQHTHYLTQHLGSCFSPQLWSIGDRSLPAFDVQDACDRRVHLRCIASDSSFVPSQPDRPAIWEDDWAADGVPALGIRAREPRWVQGVGRATSLGAQHSRLGARACCMAAIVQTQAITSQASVRCQCCCRSCSSCC